MNDKRKLHLSLYYHLKNLFVDQGYIAQSKNEELTLLDGKTYQASNDDWVYQNASKYPVTVYDNNIEVDPINYTRNFIKGTITFNDTYTIQGTITADYYYNQIHIRDAYPPKESFSVSDLPMAVIIPGQVPREGAFLGSTAYWNRYNYDIDFFGRTNSEMQDVTDDIESWLLHNTLIHQLNFASGFPLLDTGEINTLYSSGVEYSLYRRDVISVPFIAEGATEVERYRTAISFVLEDVRRF